jgi:hypothetical protein
MKPLSDTSIKGGTQMNISAAAALRVIGTQAFGKYAS